jgi:hypothetical protein
MKKAKVEIKIEPYPKGGWYVVERVNGKYGGTLLIINQWN